jgi:cyclase
MVRNRVIPALLLDKGRLVKTVGFKNPSYVGDPINVVKIFNEKEVDELIVLDISASKNGLSPDFETIQKLSSECFMPLTYGGGITRLEQASQIFSMGIEKVSIQSAAFNNINLITKIAEKYGSQSVILSIDVKRNWFGKYKAFLTCKEIFINIDLVEFIQSAVNAGAGEILLNSVNCDGKQNGYDLEIISYLSKNLSIPLIALGGAGNILDLKNALRAGASAAAAGSFFIYHGPHKGVLISYPDNKTIESLLNENS